jgi:hypothetical protein
MRGGNCQSFAQQTNCQNLHVSCNINNEDWSVLARGDVSIGSCLPPFISCVDYPKYGGSEVLRDLLDYQSTRCHIPEDIRSINNAVKMAKQT